MKKVLIITYYWPPAGGIGVLRCLKIAKYLRKYGWEPVIFTAKDASYQFLDFNNEKDIPEGLEIHKVPLFDPTDLFKKISGRKKNQPLQNITHNSGKRKTFIDKLGMWVRGNFFIPDARYRWIKPSVSYLEKYLQENKIDAVFSDGPPHTNTVIALRIAQKFNIPWLADFQDPWTQVDYYSQLYIGKSADRKHKALEQEVFQMANAITIASPSWKKDLESIGAKNVSVLYYGYDEDDFSGYSSETAEKFIIFHGGLLGSDRNPETLFAVLQELFEENPSLKEKVELRLAGEVDVTVKETISRYGLDSVTVHLGMIPRKEVYTEYARASLLLLPVNKAANANGRIPGKLFEMLRSGKKILVLGPDAGDVKKIVEESRSGKSFEYNDSSSIKEFMLQSLNEPAGKNVHHIPEQFSNEEQTATVARLLNEITS